MLTRCVSLPGRGFWGDMDGLPLGRDCFFRIMTVTQVFKNEFARSFEAKGIYQVIKRNATNGVLASLNHFMQPPLDGTGVEIRWHF